jgi:hypothetical protein
VIGTERLVRLVRTFLVRALLVTLDRLTARGIDKRMPGAVCCQEFPIDEIDSIADQRVCVHRINLETGGAQDTDVGFSLRASLALGAGGVRVHCDVSDIDRARR